MQLEFHQVDLRYTDLRIVNRRRQAQLMVSLCEHGQQQAVLVVPNKDEPRRYVLIDGYKRFYCLRRLGHDVVLAVTLPVEEDEMLCLSFTQEKSKKSVFEEGWFIHLLTQRFGWTQAHLAMRLNKSKSWVSRRLALMENVSPLVHQHVRQGYLCPHGAMRHLVPLARANPSECDELIRGLGKTVISHRQLGMLSTALRTATQEERKRICTQPLLFLKAEQACMGDTPSGEEASDEETIHKDLKRLGALAQKLGHRLEQCPLFDEGYSLILEDSWVEVLNQMKKLQGLFEEHYHVKKH